MSEKAGHDAARVPFRGGGFQPRVAEAKCNSPRRERNNSMTRPVRRCSTPVWKTIRTSSSSIKICMANGASSGASVFSPR